MANLQVFPDAGSLWHPGRSARLGLGPKAVLASFGELHPRLARQIGAPVGTVAAEIYLDAIPEPRSGNRARAAFAPQNQLRGAIQDLDAIGRHDAEFA